MHDPLAVVVCGRLGYGEAMAMQQRLVEARQQGRGGDVLLLLEHRPVITLGRNARAEHVLLSAAELRTRGIELAECDRGGDVTYHGPGQLVGYPILDLRAAPRPAFLAARPRRTGLGAVEYVRALEEVLLATAAEFGVDCERIPGRTGVWTRSAPPRKLAAIGVHIARGVTSHGFALNVEPQAGFGAIVPCGIADAGVTSLAAEAGAAPEMGWVQGALARQFARVFARAARRRAWSEIAAELDARQSGEAGELAATPLFMGP